MHFEAVINARNSNMLHSVLFTLRAAMMGDRCWYFTKSIPEPARNRGGLKLPLLKKKEKGKGWERQHQIKSETHLLQRNMYKGQATAQLTAGDSLVASPQNTFCALFLSEDINTERKQKELWKFATIPLQIWAIYVLDEFLNSTALAVELRAKVTGMELTAVRTTRSHTVLLHLSFCSHFCWTVQCW